MYKYLKSLQVHLKKNVLLEPPPFSLFVKVVEHNVYFPIHSKSWI